ncbi:gag-pol polyprotein [Tanacetum coccineum]
MVIHDVNGQASVPVKGNEACFLSIHSIQQATQVFSPSIVRPAKVTDDSKWDEMDGNAIANLHLALACEVLSSIDEKKSAKEIWDHLARFCKIDSQERAEILLQILPDSYDQGGQANQFKIGGSFSGDEREVNETWLQWESQSQNVASTSEDGNALCCEAAVANEGKKRFADDVRHVEGLKKNLLSLRQLVDLGCKVEIQNKIMKIIRARAMLATASLGKSFWAEAVNTTCYLINRSPSTAVELKTPMEMWTGKPEVDIIKKDRKPSQNGQKLRHGNGKRLCKIKPRPKDTKSGSISKESAVKPSLNIEE